MPEITQSQASYNRIETFLRNLLNYYIDRSFQPNYAIDEKSQDNVTIKWMEKSADTAKLMVRGTLNDLLDFTDTDNKYSQKAADNLKHDFGVLAKKLEIQEDLRARTQGSKEWHFSLTLWDRYSVAKNLSEFQQLWVAKKRGDGLPESSTSSPPNHPEPVDEKSDDIASSSSPATCIYGDGNYVAIDGGKITVINNPFNTSDRTTQQTKYLLRMDILSNIQNMDARLDLIHNALAPDFFLK